MSLWGLAVFGRQVVIDDSPATWFGRYRTRVRPATYERRKDLGRHIVELAPLRFQQITARLVEDVTTRVAVAHPRTAEMVLQTIKAVLRNARARGQRVNEEVFDLRGPRHESRIKRFLTKVEVDRLADASTESNLIRFAALTGLRQHELFDLTDEDVNPEDRSITVSASKTQAGLRTVPLASEARRALAQQRLARPAGAVLLFPSPNGSRWGKDNFNHRVFRKAVERAGYARGSLTFHDLRHTFASLMIAAGTHPKILQSVMGHKDIRVTMNTYGHLYDGAEEAAIEQFDRFLRGVSPHERPTGHLDAPSGIDREPASLDDGAYRDRTGDLRLAKLNRTVPAVSVCFRSFPPIPLVMRVC